MASAWAYAGVYLVRVAFCHDHALILYVYPPPASSGRGNNDDDEGGGGGEDSVLTVCPCFSSIGSISLLNRFHLLIFTSHPIPPFWLRSSSGGCRSAGGLELIVFLGLGRVWG